jgi:hypothetical protein
MSVLAAALVSMTAMAQDRPTTPDAIGPDTLHGASPASGDVTKRPALGHTDRSSELVSSSGSPRGKTRAEVMEETRRARASGELERLARLYDAP